MKLVLHFDGGNRGKTLVAAGAAVAYDVHGNEVATSTHLLRGEVSNNIAEYTGLILAFQLATRLGVREVEILGDSELIVRHFTGEYACRAEHLKPYLALVRGLAQGFEKCDVRVFPKGGPKHKRRYGNMRADELANQAMDAGERESR